VGGNTAINANGSFAGTFGPVTGGRGDGTGTLSATSTGTATGPTVTNSVNNANVFSGGLAIAENQFGSAGGLGYGASTVGSSGGTTANLMGGATLGTGTGTGYFNNGGVAAFVVPPYLLGATGLNYLGATGSTYLGATGSITANPLTANSLGAISGFGANFLP
jgi:hypothetical protein